MIATMTDHPQVAVLMGSHSDWAVMQHAVRMLHQLAVPHEARVVSAHRTPDLLFEYCATAAQRGFKVLICGAGGAAHLPGMAAAKTILPVIGVPLPATVLSGVDALLSIAQMPKGVPVATMAIGISGAINAALHAAQILALGDPQLASRLETLRREQAQAVLDAAPLQLEDSASP
jgi:5-(carboxyamino)imidazole ribonucleotide mutase